RIKHHVCHGGAGIKCSGQRRNATSTACIAGDSRYLDPCGQYYRSVDTAKSAERTFCSYRCRTIQHRKGITCLDVRSYLCSSVRLFYVSTVVRQISYWGVSWRNSHYVMAVRSQISTSACSP